MINLGSTAGISLAMAKGMNDAAKVTGTLAELRAVARGRSYHPVIGGHCRR